MPECIGSDNEVEFTVQSGRDLLAGAYVQTAYIGPVSLWEYGHIVVFQGKLRHELLNGEIFDILLGAKYV